MNMEHGKHHYFIFFVCKVGSSLALTGILGVRSHVESSAFTWRCGEPYVTNCDRGKFLSSIRSSVKCRYTSVKAKESGYETPQSHGRIIPAVRYLSGYFFKKTNEDLKKTKQVQGYTGAKMSGLKLTGESVVSLGSPLTFAALSLDYQIFAGEQTAKNDGHAWANGTHSSHKIYNFCLEDQSFESIVCA